MFRCPRVLLLLGFGLTLASPATAVASPLIETMGGVGSNAGFQGVVTGPGAASTYFNPAMLTDASDEISVGPALIEQQIGVTLQGRTPGADVPLIVGGRGVTSNGQPLPASVVPTQWLNQGGPNGFTKRPRQAQGNADQTFTYLTFGLAKTIVADRLTLGIYGMLPVSNFTNAQPFFPDEREALFSNSLHPELYGDRLTAVSLVFGASFKIVPALSVGAAVSVGLASTATSSDYVQSATDYSKLLLENRVTTNVNVSPTFGLRYQPVDWLRFGGAVHAPESFTVNTAVSATLPSGTESATTQQNVFDWMPWSVVVGAEVAVLRRTESTTSIVASGSYQLWSQYTDRMGQSPSTYGSDMAFQNTFSGAFGVRQTYKDARFFVDFRYLPSPVPTQVANSNYVDNSRAGVGLGGDVKLGFLKIRPGVQFFADRFIPRSNQKDESRITDQVPDNSIVSSTGAPVVGAQGLQTNNPGWPGFSSSGWLWGGAVTLSMPL
jgi:hypothetical protein